MSDPRAAATTEAADAAIEQPWAATPEAVLEALGTDPERGLDDDEVRRRRQEHGPNRLREAVRRSAWRILWEQVKSLIMVLLAVAVVVSVAFGQHVEAVAIVVVIVVNAAIGFFTELRAVRSMEALRELGQADSKVIREGEERTVAAVELVPGDVVVLEPGEVIGADQRLISVDSLQADESALTGESVPVAKQAEAVGAESPLAERASMAYKGTAVTRGRGTAVVVATGTDTEIGDVSRMVEEAEAGEIPLERRLDALGGRLVWLTMAVAAVVSTAGIVAGREVFLMIQTGIALAVAAIPEGLPIVATIALARGVHRMARRNALVRRLSSVETLGSATVICSDKTGTLTENRMRVHSFELPEGRVDVAWGEDGSAALERREGDAGGDPLDELPTMERAVRVAVLANDAEEPVEGEEGAGGADPMELALLRLGREVGRGRSELVARFEQLRKEPFDRDTQRMSSYHRRPEGGILVAVKGAPEAVLEASSRVLTSDGEEPLDGAGRERWRERSEVLAAEGLRVLGLGYRESEDAEDDDARDEDLGDDLTLVGLVALRDPPQSEVPDAVAACRRAGIRVVMVTGDHPATARQIAASVGLGDADELRVVTGDELERAAAEGDGAEGDVLDADVFSRVDPRQKLDLIAGYQRRGEIVAMTGDGVNDAPALKSADIGVAMGERGTEVAREAADMVLLDDAFSSITAAVRYGRVIFANVRKFVVYLLSGNVGEIAAVGVASVLGAPLPLLPLQILYLNLVNDVFPALALGVGTGEREVMERPPRDPEEAVLERCHWGAVVGYGVVIAATILGAFLFALHRLGASREEAVTAAFLVLSLSRLLHVFNMRDPDTGVFRNEVVRNPFVWGAIALCLGLLVVAVYVGPLAEVLGLTPPTPAQWALIVGASTVPLLLGQLYLAVTGRRGE